MRITCLIGTIEFNCLLVSSFLEYFYLKVPDLTSDTFTLSVFDSDKAELLVFFLVEGTEPTGVLQKSPASMS